MKKALTILLFTYVLFATVKPVLAQGLPVCSFGELTSPGEFKDYISIQWNIKDPYLLSLIKEFRISAVYSNGNGQNYDGYPKETTSALLTGLPHGIYTVTVYPIGYTNDKIADYPAYFGCDPSSKINGEVKVAINECGDNVLGKFEECDGTSLNGKSCTNFNGYEGGTLKCNPNTCTFDKTSCQYCNDFSSNPVRIDNNLNQSNIVVANSHFSCILKPDRTQTSPAVSCALSRLAHRRGDPVSPAEFTSCAFQSWDNNNQAIFDCIAPSATSNPQYSVNAIFAAKNDPNSSASVDISNSCGSPIVRNYSKEISIVPATTTPPTVKALETNTISNNVSDFRNVKITVNCDTNTSNVNTGCDSNSFKLQKFTTKPDSCPTELAGYNITTTTPYPNTSSSTVWYCATAVDNIGNRGFSIPLEVKPGCRDQCSISKDRTCIIGPGIAGTNVQLIFPSMCSPSTVSACLELRTLSTCSTSSSAFSSYCTTAGREAICTRAFKAGGLTIPNDAGPAGSVVDTVGKGLANVSISIIGGGSGSTPLTLGSGSFSSLTLKTTDSRNGAEILYEGSATTSVTPPPGYRLQQTKCIVRSGSSCQSVDRPEQDKSCQVKLPFIKSTYDNCDVPTIQFILEKQNPNPPVINFPGLPNSIAPNAQVDIATHVTNAFGTNLITIYANDKIIKECPYENAGAELDCPVSPATISTTFQSTPNPATVYAVVKSIDGTVTKSEIKTLTVSGSSTGGGGGGTGGGGGGAGGGGGGGGGTGGGAGTTASPGCSSALNNRATGLVTTPRLDPTSVFSTSGGCVADPKTFFYKIPSFDELKSIYFDQSKLPKEGADKQLYTLGDNPSSIDLRTRDKIYFVNGNLTIDNPSDISGNQTGVIFVKGNLNIGPIPGNKLQQTPQTETSGLVFVVKGDVNIDSSVTQIDAIIISEGIIYTAGANCTTNNVTTGSLTINGSFISINPGGSKEPIQFCRSLAGSLNTNQPAEKINHQIKYLPILRNLFSFTYQKWSEIP